MPFDENSLIIYKQQTFKKENMEIIRKGIGKFEFRYFDLNFMFSRFSQFFACP